jgi:indole-3-glycerol phosphate synthase
MILDEIVARRRQDVERARRETPIDGLRETPLFRERRRGFAAALRQPGRRIVAEVKKASPSAGLIRADFDAVAIARDYAASGAAGLSVLTEEHYFQGRGEYLAAIRRVVDLPLLRKDFTFDVYQVVEARALGADAVLLIVSILAESDLRALLAHAREIGLDALVEVHDEIELQRALDAGADLIGINNRDLRTFATSLEVTERLVGRVPDEVTVVAESGIANPADISRLEGCGVRAFLIGETFMRAPRPGEKLKELLRA